MQSKNERYQSYLESWSNELKARADRVRQLIGDAHWLSDGNHKEYIIRDFITRYLPESQTVGHGFIRTISGECSNEIDILVSGNNSYPPYFNEGGLLILPPENVSASMEIKTKYKAPELRQALTRHAKIHAIYHDAGIVRRPWLGVFFYDSSSNVKNTLKTLKKETETILSDFAQIATTAPSLTSSHRQLPLPNCVVVLDKYLAMFRQYEDPYRVGIILFETKKLSFALAVTDFYSHVAAKESHGERQTSMEICQELIPQSCIHKIELNIEVE